MSTQPLKILFVINPGSGPKARINWEPSIRAYFKQLPHLIEFFLLADKNDAGSLAYWIEKIKPDRVVAVGGDGTVSLVAQQLLGTNISMGILPAGSANGMARELNIPTNVEGAIKVMLEGEIKDTDVIRINDSEICIHLSDIGINAQIIKYFEEGKFRGKLAYARMLIKALWKRRIMKVEIEMNGSLISTGAYMVVIANASKYGTGAMINPQGNLYDGKFEVVIVRRIAFSEFLKLFIRYRQFDPKKVEVFQTQSVQIETKRKVHFQVDGEYLGKISSVKAYIQPSKLKLILPRSNS